MKLLVEKLPSRQQLVLTYRHGDGLSYSKIADRLGISEANARKIWSRAMAKLRQWLKEEDSAV